ncbi:MAG: ABC transporter permease, partial [Phycisphaerae bacterium]
MLRLAYLYRNLARNKLRTLLTVAAVALPIMIYVLSMAVVDGVERFLDNASRQLRLAVTHKTSLINPLPAGYRKKIEALDPTGARLLSVCGLRWLGGKIPDDPRPLSTLACEHDTFVATFPEYRLTPDEIAAWLRDRRAVIVGSATARRFGWKVGDRITVNPSLPPYTPIEFNVISTAPDAEDKDNLMCRVDYVDEELAKTGWKPGLIGFYFVKCASRADLEYFREAIDQRFAGT